MAEPKKKIRGKNRIYNKCHFGFLGVVLGITGIMVGRIITKKTDELIKSEDERAKKIIAEGNERLEKFIAESR